MEQLRKFNDLNCKTWKWDTHLRLVQYFCKALAATGRGGPLARVLDGELGNYRVVTRFQGFFQSVQRILELMQEKGRRERKKAELDARLEMVQEWSMVGYYPLEMVAWLSDRKVSPRLPPSDGLWRLSCQLWLFYVICALARLWLQVDRSEEPVQQRLRRFLVASVSDPAFIYQWSNVILAWHWSVRSSPFSPATIGIVGFLGTALKVAQTWL